MSRKLSVGIVGLPNVGKSTLFNAITQSSVEASNYPFCTIEPNSGIVKVPDNRLKQLAQVSQSDKTIHATIEFFDIAGLVKGASDGEGLGNQFLSNIRQTSAIAHVVRCFDDPDIVHVNGRIDPLGDIEIINTELILSDLMSVEKGISNQEKRVKTNDKEEVRRLEILCDIKDALSQGIPVRDVKMPEESWVLIRSYQFITQKSVIYVPNVHESDVVSGNSYVEQVREYASQRGDQCCLVSAKIESELSVLSDIDQKDFMTELGLKESGLSRLASSGFSLLGLQTFLTTGPSETRAWTIATGMTASESAGVIHTDFQKGFICAEVLGYQDFIRCQGWKNAKCEGAVRQEGRDYVMKDGDIVEFRFNV
jgi:GTP-binding protein YchF